jgi:putative membrane protein
MFDNLAGFLIQWGITALSLWGASLVFNGIRFASTSALIISALLLGFANAVLRPLLFFLTLPLTLLTLGFFVLVINALMLLLVAKLVKGFTISGFWTAFFASLFISILSIALGTLAPNAETTIYRLPPSPSVQTISA